MKLMFASDIHGSAYYCKKLIEAFQNEKAEKLVLLGDILYHGPRNALPTEYDPPAVASMLNAISDDLLCVRGNCDSEVDQMVLNFPVLSDSLVLWADGVTMFCTHGHIFNTSNPPKLANGDILIHGHTHVKVAEPVDHYVFINPGSVSIPKDGDDHSYMTYEDGVFTIRSFEGKVCKMFTVNK